MRYITLQLDERTETDSRTVRRTWSLDQVMALTNPQAALMTELKSLVVELEKAAPVPLAKASAK
jgi:hypothetical protein